MPQSWDMGKGNGDATTPYLGQAAFALDFEGWSDEFIYLFFVFALSDFAHKSKLCKYPHIPPFESPFRTRPDRLSLLRNGYPVCSPEV
jgi:hypothetical protein